MGKDYHIFLALRLLSVFLVSTAYVPDEYWQSLEVAHYFTFGYGYLTWEWQEGIRSYLYPLLISAIYKLLALLHLDYAYILVVAPRIIQAFLTAYADVSLLRWVRNPLFGRSPWAKITIVTAYYWYYVGTRTLYNTVETDLIMVALSLYPWPPSRTSDSAQHILWAALACAIRPTASIVLIPLFLYHLFSCTQRLRLLLKYIIAGAFTFGLVVGVDSLASGSLTITPLNFVKINVMQGIGSFYGEHGFLWYFTNGLPMMLGIHLIPFLYQAFLIIRGPNRQPYDVLMLVVFVITVCVFSIQPHKETRFLLPLLPIALFWTAGGLNQIERLALKKNWTRLVKSLPWILLASSLIPSIYIGLVHQRGTISAVSWLSSKAKQCPQQTSILFLMPCHSTPLYSHLHVNVPTRILTCVPDLGSVPDPNYQDEAKLFYSNPASWLSQNYPEPQRYPSHIVHFDSLEGQLSSFLKSGGFSNVTSFFYTHFPSDRVGRNVVIQERAAALKSCPNL